VRALFETPVVTPSAEVELKWSDPDEAGILEFLVEQKGFSADRIAGGIAKLKKLRTGGQQMRMDAFFKPSTSAAPPASSGVKRAAEDAKAAAKAAAKSGGKGGGKGAAAGKSGAGSASAAKKKK